LIVVGRSFTIYTPSNQDERINKMVDVKMQTWIHINKKKKEQAGKLTILLIK
jgi:hypothetical protein